MEILPAEHEILLRCATSQLSPDRAERIRRLVAAEPEWDTVLHLAEQHGVLPLLYWSLTAIPEGGVPPRILARLDQQFRLNAARSLRLASQVINLMRAAESRGARVVPWKGPTLAAGAYGHLGLRTFADLDFLTARADLAQAGQALAAQGLRPETPLPDLRVWPFTREADGLVVELHWAPAPWAHTVGLDVAELRTEPLAIGDHVLTHLAPGDLLVVLCVHGAKHRWDRLQWIVDVAELIRRRPDLDWRRVQDLAAESGSSRIVQLGLRLAQELLDASLPEAADCAAADRTVGQLASLVARRLFRTVPGPPRGSERVRDILFQLRVRERMRDRLRYALGVPVGRAWRAWSGMVQTQHLAPLRVHREPTRRSAA